MTNDSTPPVRANVLAMAGYTPGEQPREDDIIRTSKFTIVGRITTPTLKARAEDFGELKRRNVYKVAVAYAVVGWLLVQVATQVFPFLEIPNWVIRLVILLTALGFEFI